MCNSLYSIIYFNNYWIERHYCEYLHWVAQLHADFTVIEFCFNTLYSMIHSDSYLCHIIIFCLCCAIDRYWHNAFSILKHPDNGWVLQMRIWMGRSSGYWVFTVYTLILRLSYFLSIFSYTTIFYSENMVLVLYCIIQLSWGWHAVKNFLKLIYICRKFFAYTTHEIYNTYFDFQ